MTDASSGGAAAPAPERARESLDLMCGILRRYGEQEVADLAELRASGATQSRSVVVVGEVKRGKSFLVNALVGLRDASPVGVEVTTSTTVAVGPATPEQPAGRDTLWFPSRAEQVPHAELADWVSCDGVRVTDPQVDELPTRAYVPVDGHRLDDVTVIDTPGVGGLDPSFAALAAATAEQACVLVVVCDASTPVTAPEMEFIRSTGASVEALIVAVTKTDKNLRRWRPIVAQNRELLREHLGRDVPVVGVSSLRAVLAAEMPPGPGRDLAEDHSGIAALRREIGERLAGAEHLPLANGLRTAIVALAGLAERERTSVAVLTDSARALPELTAKADELERLRIDTQQWELHLHRDLTLIRQQALDELDRRLKLLREDWSTRINKGGMAVLRKNPQHFTARMEKDFQEAIAGAISVFLAELHSRIIRPRFESDVVWEEILQLIHAAMAGHEFATHRVESKTQNLIDPSMLTMGVVGSSAIAGIVGVSTVVGVGAVVGVAWVGVNLGFRAMRSGKTNLLSWMRETSGSTKTTTSRMLEAAIAQSRPEIVIRYRTHLKESIAELKAHIAEAEAAARADSEQREADLVRHRKNAAILARYIDRGETLIGELSSAAPAPALVVQR